MTESPCLWLYVQSAKLKPRDDQRTAGDSFLSVTLWQFSVTESEVFSYLPKLFCTIFFNVRLNQPFVCTHSFILHLPPPSVTTLLPLFPHSPLSSTPLQPSVLQQMVLGSKTTAEHGGGPPGVHTYTPWTASVYQWADNSPSPDSYSWQREGGRRKSSKAKGGIKKNKAVTTGGGKEGDNKVAFANMFYGLFFSFFITTSSSKTMSCILNSNN